MKTSFKIFWLVLLFCFVAINSATADGPYLSPSVVIADNSGKTLYIAEHTAKQIAVFDVSEQKVSKIYQLPQNPNGLAISPDGLSLYVTCDGPKGYVSVIDTKTGRTESVLMAGHNPTAPVIASEEKKLYVCEQFKNKVIAIDIASGNIIAEISVMREPFAATLSNKKLFVANSLPAGRADGGFIAGAVSVIDTVKNKISETIILPNGSINLKGIAASPNGKHIYVTHLLARYQVPTTQLERGWVNTNAMTTINADDNKVMTTVLLDNLDLGAANPWGIACTDDGKFICIAHAGTHEISVIDRLAMHKKIEKISKSEKVSYVCSSLEDIQSNLSFLAQLRHRIALDGNGPRNLTIIGTNVYISEYFSDSIAVVNINPEVRANAISLPLGPNNEMTITRKGEMLFNDATICFQKWQSCASCHPGNARADAINWDLLNDGIGYPKNTKSLLLSHKTPPSMTSGIRENAEAGVRAGIKHILFSDRPETDAIAIDKYLKSLKPLASPHLVKSRFTKNLKLSKAAKKGRKIFNKAGCSSCHLGPMFTDMASYDVGTGKEREKGMLFDTPTLIEVWRTSPYLHDGRAVTIKEVLTDFNIDDKHGKTSDLTDKQIDDLVEYILSL